MPGAFPRRVIFPAGLGIILGVCGGLAAQCPPAATTRLKGSSPPRHLLIKAYPHIHTEVKSPQRPRFLLNYCHLYFLHICANRDRNGGVLKNNKMYLHTFPYVQVNSHK